MKQAWNQVDPAPLVWNWHLDVLCAHLQAVTEGRIRRLLINMPPGHAKSMIVSVLWPAWEWAVDPRLQTLFASYDLDLVLRDAVKSRNLIRSEWYRKNFTRQGTCDAWELTPGMDAKSYYTNTNMGTRRSVSVGSGTGWRADKQVIDDPLKADDAYSEAARKGALVWLNETMPSRLNNLDKGARVMVMQRLHEEDPSGWILKNEDWEHVILASEFAPGQCKCKSCSRGKTAIGWRDPRKQEGDLLFPKLFPKTALEELKVSLGPLAYAGQYQQSPVPASGGMIREAWTRNRWLRAGEKATDGLNTRALPTKFDRVSIVGDLSFKKAEDSDRVALGVWGRSGPDLYLLDCVWQRMGMVETLDAIRGLSVAYPAVREILIEEAANGAAVIDVLHRELTGIRPIKPEGSKEARVAASVPAWAAGNVWLPQSASWVRDAIGECLSFPKGAHDDFIDCAAHAINHCLPRRGLDSFRAMAKL